MNDSESSNKKINYSNKKFKFSNKNYAIISNQYGILFQVMISYVFFLSINYISGGSFLKNIID